METIATVLATLGAVALVHTILNVMRLTKRIDELELMRMEIVDMETKIDRCIDLIDDLKEDLNNKASK